jgi:hypothetical protein
VGVIRHQRPVFKTVFHAYRKSSCLQKMFAPGQRWHLAQFAPTEKFVFKKLDSESLRIGHLRERRHPVTDHGLGGSRIAGRGQGLGVQGFVKDEDGGASALLRHLWKKNFFSSKFPQNFPPSTPLKKIFISSNSQQQFILKILS